ncbi:MAG: glycogen-binding domain-containing protein [Treponemataceae bacterium]|nr:glycogen-binding domain-containing protein [Treponemataceae bacterium]
MKKLNLFLACAIFCAGASFAAKEKEVPLVESKYSFEYREIAQKLLNPSAPFEKDGMIVFSAEEGPHYVGIAFDFENFQKIHSFQKRILLDENGEKSSAWYFYILEEYPNTDRILYRLIIDGLWTTDPMNPKQHYDETTGIHLSQIDVKHKYEMATSVKTSANGKSVHFVYKGKSGQNVRVAGTFSNWDSWIYQLSETSRGFYELTLPMNEGTYYYVYCIGTKEFPDTTNHSRAIKDGGKAVSKIIVNDE